MRLVPARTRSMCRWRLTTSASAAGVTDVLIDGGWNAIGVNVTRQAPDPEEYPNLRSALWFGLSEAAAQGNVSFARLPQPVLADLRRELTAPTYTLDVRGAARSKART